jgi:hypothetical protein
MKARYEHGGDVLATDLLDECLERCARVVRTLDVNGAEGVAPPASYFSDVSLEGGEFVLGDQ